MHYLKVGTRYLYSFFLFFFRIWNYRSSRYCRVKPPPPMFANNSRPPTTVDYNPGATHSPPQLATSSRLNGHGGPVIQPARMATTSSIPILNVKNKRGMFDTWSTRPEWIDWSCYRDDQWILQSKRLSWCWVVESTSSISVLCSPRRSQFTSELTIRIWGNDHFCFDNTFFVLISYYFSFVSTYVTMATPHPFINVFMMSSKSITRSWDPYYRGKPRWSLYPLVNGINWYL